MTYEEALAFWYGRIDYERRQPRPGDLKLDRMRALLRRLGDPHLRVRCVHIAGTKGKGSTSAILASVLRAAGYRTGLFTSPHLSDVSERVQVDGVPISHEEIAFRMSEVAAAVGAMDSEGDTTRSPTFFEIITALGFLHFDCRRVEIAVLEVGLGGRFDSTNVCEPLATIITNISYDHMALLGNTLAEIAFQKAGIIKRRVPVVTTAESAEVLAIISKVADKLNAPVFTIGEDKTPVLSELPRQSGGARSETRVTPAASPRFASGSAASIQELNSGEVFIRQKRSLVAADVAVQCQPPSPFQAPCIHVSTWRRDYTSLHLNLFGVHQAKNAAGVVAVIECLRVAGLVIPDGAVADGLRTVCWPARMELISRSPVVVVDCAHNVASAVALVRTMRESFPVTGRRHLIFSASTDKQIPEMLDVLAPAFEHFHLTRYRSNPRSADPAIVQQLLRKLGVSAIDIHSGPEEAWQAARKLAGPDDGIVVAGSVFLAGELRPIIVRDCQS